MDDSNLSQPHSWSRICTGNSLLEIQQQSSALWQLSMVKPVHVGIFTCVFLQPPWLRFLLPYPWSKISILPMFSVYGTHWGSSAGLFGRCDSQGPGRVSKDMFLLHCAMEEPIPNPTLASLKALYLCSSPGEFLSITKNYLISFVSWLSPVGMCEIQPKLTSLPKFIWQNWC